jgi:hypothetical protein
MPALPHRPRTRLPRAVAPAVLTLVAVLALTGCGKSETPKSASTPAPTPIGQLNTDAMTLARVDFCALLPDAAVREALDGGLGDQVSWRNGERALIDTGTSDVAHEYGCAWTRAGYAASAWIFARPITTEFAKAVLDKTSHRNGCTAEEGPDFGSPHQQQTCTLSDGTKRVRLAGLFKDTFLTCQVQAPAKVDDKTLSERTYDWCVQVANATNIAK